MDQAICAPIGACFAAQPPYAARITYDRTPACSCCAQAAADGAVLRQLQMVPYWLEYCK